MENDFYAVIMAGGGGTRLWPLSTKDHPKQMLKFAKDETMFQMTVSRLTEKIPFENILVVTTEDQAAKLKQQCNNIPEENYLIEPLPRGTASVIGLAAIHLEKRMPGSIMAVIPSDHFVLNEKQFLALLENGYQAAKDQHLVTLGVKPSFPSTGMGYIEQGEKIPVGYDLYHVGQFREKPDKETAEYFVQSGKFWWNAGIFVWSSRRILNEIAMFLPDLSKKLDIINATIDRPDYTDTMEKTWRLIEPATIDYGVLEKTTDVVFLPTYDLGWNDIGSWESLFDVIPPDENGNIIINCKFHSIDSDGVLACSENKEKMIVSIGVKNMIIIETEKAVLVCPRSETQRVREIVDFLKKNNLTAYL